MKRMIDKFDNKLYEERRVFIESIFENICKDNESIFVDAKLGEKCPWFIKIEYNAIRGKEMHTDSASIPIDIAMKISNVTMSALIVDLMSKFRSD